MSHESRTNALAHYEVYCEHGSGEWRWRLVHRNGNIIADSGESYSSKAKVMQGLDSVRANAADAPIEITDDN